MTTPSDQPEKPPAGLKPGYWQRLKAHIVHPELTPNQVGWSFGLGLSVAFNPLLGLHLAMVLTLCFAFKGLHRPLMLAASFVNNPWTTVPIATATAYFGNILLGRGLDLNMRGVDWTAIGWHSFTTREGAQAMFAMLKPILAPYLVGGFLLSLLAIPLGYFVMFAVAKRLKALHAAGAASAVPDPELVRTGDPMDIRFLMRQAQAMQDKLKAAQEAVRAEGTAGGEMVKVVVNGAKEVQSISIAKEAMDPEDPSMLEDLVLAAFKDAGAKADAEMQKHTAGFAGGLNIPGLKL